MTVSGVMERARGQILSCTVKRPVERTVELVSDFSKTQR